ncbi:MULTISPECIES: hypothetical protein [unclassified Knoellia]|uniref:hypothetical protein n=1 Tax=Knoellia altitudinis TaxID=3404795 RepID=UPI00360E5C57
MSENDKDPRPGEFTDPTASPDWTAPSSASSSDQADEAAPSPEPPQSSPTEQIPQGSPFPPAQPGPPSPGYDAPYQAPRGESYPYAGSSAQPTNPYAATPPPAPQDPYAVPQPAYDPYAASGAQGQQAGYPAYQAPGQWQTPPPGYGAPPPQNTSALVLTIISGIVTVSCCLPGIAPLILGIMALSKQSTDPEASRRLSKWGWIAFAIGAGLAVIGLIAFIAVGVAGGFDDGGYSSDSDYSY